MNKNVKVLLPVVGLIIAGIGATQLLGSDTIEPDLYDFTSQALKDTSLFQSCDKNTPSLNIQIADNDKVKINGIESKVTFAAKTSFDDKSIQCSGLTISKSRLVKTPSYSMIFSKASKGYIISNLRYNQTDERIPGTWFYKDKS